MASKRYRRVVEVGTHGHGKEIIFYRNGEGKFYISGTANNSRWHFYATELTEDMRAEMIQALLEMGEDGQ